MRLLGTQFGSISVHAHIYRPACNRAGVSSVVSFSQPNMSLAFVGSLHPTICSFSRKHHGDHASFQFSEFDNPNSICDLRFFGSIQIFNIRNEAINSFPKKLNCSGCIRDLERCLLRSLSLINNIVIPAKTMHKQCQY